MKHIDTVLSILERESLYAKMSKCEFGMIEFLYLGYIISVGSIRVDPDKIRAILDCHHRGTLHNSRDFSGFVDSTADL